MVTVESTFDVIPNEKIKMSINRSLFDIPLQTTVFSFMYLQNNSDSTIKIHSFSGFGDYLQINYPKDF